MHLGWRGMGLAAAFGWAVGCGGIVVVDSEGAGGSGAAPTGSGMTTAISVTATGQGGGGPQGVCDALCAIGGALGCDWGESDCLAQCLQFYTEAGTCSGQLDAYFACVLSSLADCEVWGSPCDPYLEAYLECMNGSSGCDEYECIDGSDGSCGCKGYCNGQVVDATCVAEASGSLSCSCVADGQVLGTCQGSVDACNPESGCCAAYFFSFDE